MASLTPTKWCDRARVAGPARVPSRGDRRAEVVDHSAGGVERAVVVLECLAVRPLPLGDRGGELVKVGVDQCGQPPAGLDE